MARRPKRSGLDAKGRSKGSPRHIRFYRSMLHCPAYRTLPSPARAVLIELYDLYDGQNNGELFLSVRRAAERCLLNKDTAGKALQLLRERGFIRLRVEAHAEADMRYARCWVLTEYPFAGRAPTRDFLAWRPEDEKAWEPVP